MSIHGQAQRFNCISETKSVTSFPLIDAGTKLAILTDASDARGLSRVADDLACDFERVGAKRPARLFTWEYESQKDKSSYTAIIIIGTITGNSFLKKYISKGLMDASALENAWEAGLLTSFLDQGLPVLVCAGSDRRGAIYTSYCLSQELGVSPWHWWSETPSQQRTQAYVKSGVYTLPSPAIQYRGIFLNDEYPALTRWVAHRFGNALPDVANYGRLFYSKVFELILRLRGNYLWPAMWNNAFNEDDAANAALADEYGIVMGTSHQEPMLRAQKEWDRRYQASLGHWDWLKHKDILTKFWADGVRRNKAFESLITIGLRGADDTEMAGVSPAESRSMLEEIAKVQREILENEVGKPINQIPQVWCLYKEVLDYYNAGLEIPDDVTLLWGEDNWGNLRRVPSLSERKRSGGAGIYYHFDYHGGPRSYQWLNTSPLGKIYDQMELAHRYEARKVWIVNVGHLKGYELPMEYFLDLAWDLPLHSTESPENYPEQWARREFGQEYAEEIGRLLSANGRLVGRRKPELWSTSTFSLLHYNEAETVQKEWKKLLEDCENVKNKLPQTMHNSFMQVLGFPAQACQLVNEIYLAAAKHQLYAKQGRASARFWGEETKRLFQLDLDLMSWYNNEFAGGKWKHFMDQTHLGYKAWNDPPHNSLDALEFFDIQVTQGVSAGLGLEGFQEIWHLDKQALGTTLTLPCINFDSYGANEKYLELFRCASENFYYTVKSQPDFIKLSPSSGLVNTDQKIKISIDWSKVSESTKGSIQLELASKLVTLPYALNLLEIEKKPGFVAADGFVALEAEHYQNFGTSLESSWEKIPQYGHTLSGMRTRTLLDLAPCNPGKNSAWLAYDFWIPKAEKAFLNLICGPGLNFLEGRNASLGWSLNNGPVNIEVLVPATFIAEHHNMDWEKTVADNSRTLCIPVPKLEVGWQQLKLWVIDPGVVVQRIIVDIGGLQKSYLGPPESFHWTKTLEARKIKQYNL